MAVTKAATDFRLDFRIESFHYTEAKIQFGAAEYSCRCFDYFDALRMLANDVAALLQHPCSQTVTKWEMNGQTWWAFDRLDDRVDVNILEFRETQKALMTLRDGSYVTIFRFTKAVFHANIRLAELATELLRALDEVDGHGAGNIEAEGHNSPYPAEAVEILQTFLAAVG